jgi:hypothetical protein
MNVSPWKWISTLPPRLPQRATAGVSAVVNAPYEAGASPAYVMAQMGHTSSALALEVYARKMERQRDTGARMDALIQRADWARMGTNGQSDDVADGVSVLIAGNGKAAEQGF